MCLDTQLCLTLCNPMDCSLPGSSVHGLFQARIPEWVAMSSSRGSKALSLVSPALAGGFFTTNATWEADMGPWGVSYSCFLSHPSSVYEELRVRGVKEYAQVIELKCQGWKISGSKVCINSLPWAASQRQDALKDRSRLPAGTPFLFDLTHESNFLTIASICLLGGQNM